MNLRDLKYLVAVADLRSFVQAANQCFVSQPTLSTQIKKMEDSLGIQVFERTNKKVLPTETGEKIIASARRILFELDNMEEIASNANDPLAGNFRLGAIPTLAAYIFPDAIPQINNALPKIRLILIEEKTDNLIEQLKQGLIDAAVLALPIQDDYLACRILFDDEFLLAVSSTHPFAKKKSISPKHLYQEQLLLLDEGHCLRGQALQICQINHIDEQQDVRATSLETLRQMVKAGTGITFIPKIAVKTPEQGIHYLPIEAPAPKRTLGLFWRKTSSRLAIVDRLAKILLAQGTSNAAF